MCDKGEHKMKGQIIKFKRRRAAAMEKKIGLK
jgi:hypothetical protein